MKYWLILIAFFFILGLTYGTHELRGAIIEGLFGGTMWWLLTYLPYKAIRWLVKAR